MVAAAIVDHLRLCNWRIARGPPWGGFAYLGQGRSRVDETRRHKVAAKRRPINCRASNCQAGPDVVIWDRRVCGVHSARSSEMTRHLPPPWRAEKFSGGYVVRDANGFAVAYVYGRSTEVEAMEAKQMTMDEARRVATVGTKAGCASPFPMVQRGCPRFFSGTSPARRAPMASNPRAVSAA